MTNREKRLLWGLIGVTAVGVFASFIYPKLIRPTFDYADEIDRARDELDELAEKNDTLEIEVRDKYRTYALRSGGVDPSQARDELYEALDALLRSFKFKGGKITPKQPNIDRKSKVATLKISVSATGTLSQCVDFVRAFYKLPNIARINTLKLDPVRSPQKARADEVRLDAEIEALVVPETPAWGVPTGKPPSDIDRVASKDISPLRNWKPFDRYVAPAPKPTPSPADLATKPSPTPGPTPAPRVPETWPDADEYVVRAFARYGTGSERVGEVLLDNVVEPSKSRYIAVGDDFDAGELVLVHALGAVAHKMRDDKDFGYWVYPLGEMLTGRLKLEDSAGPWPEIYFAMQRHLAGPQPAAFKPPAAGDDIPALDVVPSNAEIQAKRNEALDQLFFDVATSSFPTATNGEMGPPLPDGFKGPDVSTDADTNGANPAASSAASEPRRIHRSGVQKSGRPDSRDVRGRLVGESKSTRPNRAVKHKSKPASASASAPAPAPRGGSRTGSRVRGEVKAADEDTNEETDDVPPPE